MKTLKLYDGTTFSVLDSSNSSCISMQVESFAQVDEIKTHFTRENMIRIELGKEISNQVNPLCVSASETDGEIICSIFCQSSMEYYLKRYLDDVIEQMIAEGVID